VEVEIKRIDNAAALTDVFGRWPSFHDAEIHALRLDRGANEPPSLEADVHVFEMTPEVTPDGFYVLKNHTLVTLRFAGIDQLELEGFNQQNVLADLVLRDISLRQLAVLKWEVEFDSSFGVGARFLCERISVLSALPFGPQDLPPAPTGTRSAARPGAFPSSAP
jgi:Immunity protein 50